MIIAPNSTVWLCSGVPFDRGYKNTKLYSSKESQFSDLSTKAIHTVLSCSYIRGKRAIRVECPYSLAYLVNYVIYKNTNFENKYFYAFVTDCTYINNSVFEFTIETDVMQTWMFDYVVKHSYVEREHVASDTLYGNRVEEGLEVGDYYVTSQGQDTYSRNFKIRINASFSVTKWDETTQNKPAEYGVPTGLITGNTFTSLTQFNFNNVNDAVAFIGYVVGDGKADGIVSICMTPISVGDFDSSNKKYSPFVGNISVYENSASATPSNNNFKEGVPFQGYSPKNKKLYCYPYRFVKVVNGRGSAAIYKWEESNISASNTRGILFKEYISGNTDSEAILVPLYNMTSGSTSYNAAHTMHAQTSMQCPWSSDAFKAWLAQNAGQIQFSNTNRKLNLASSIANAATSAAVSGTNAATQLISGIASANPAGIASGISGIANTAMQAANAGAQMLINWEREVAKLNAVIQDHEILPPESHGVSTSGQCAFDTGIGGFTFQTMSIRKEYAKIIDDYFTMYGYACHEVKVPNLNSRQSFNYIKTVGVNINGTCPSDDLQRIRNIYDNGITFWHTPLNSIGNYDLPNGSVT